MNDTIQTFWHGPRISPMEFASLQSFLRHGHTVHLYTYTPIAAIPDGCEIKDANEILPEDDVFLYRHGPGAGSVAAFSDLFRYKLLRDRGGWWVDADLICLRPFPSVPFYFAKQDDIYVNNAVMKAFPGSEIMEACYQGALQLGNDVLWGDAGPTLLSKLIPRHNHEEHVAPPSDCYPIHWTNWQAVLDRSCTAAIVNRCSNSYAIHVWQEMFRRHGANKYLRPPKDSYLDQVYSDLQVPSSLFVGENESDRNKTTVTRDRITRLRDELVRLQHELDCIAGSLLGAHTPGWRRG